MRDHIEHAVQRLRSSSGRQRCGQSAARAAALMLPALLMTACGSTVAGNLASPAALATSSIPASRPASPTRTAATNPPASQATSPARSGAFGRAVLTPQVAVTASGVYVAWQTSPPGSVVRSELARVNPATGHIAAERYLGAEFRQAVTAGGSLWVTTGSPAGGELIRLNPVSLAKISRYQLGGGLEEGPWPPHQIAVAGGGLWIDGGNRLFRLSLPAGRVTASIPLPGAATSSLAANAAGTVLVIGEADSGGRGAVQRRDPVTGAVLASRPMSGVAAPNIAGVTGSGIWVSQPTGMMGYVAHLSTATLQPERIDGPAALDPNGTRTQILGTNGITARLADRVLWITQIAGGTTRNYCGDPANGHAFAPIPLPQPAQDDILAIGHHRIFYAAPPQPGGRQHIGTEPIPAACHTR